MSFPLDEDEWTNRPVRSIMRTMFTGWGLLVTAIVLVALISIGAWGFGVLTSGAYGRGEQVKQVNSAQNRTEEYKHFFDLKATYDTQVQAVRLAKTNLDTFAAQNPADVRAADLTGNLQSTYSQDMANLTGAEQICTDTANTYNQDSGKLLTGAQFKDSSLPAQLDVNACQVAA